MYCVPAWTRRHTAIYHGMYDQFYHDTVDLPFQDHPENENKSSLWRGAPSEKWVFKEGWSFINVVFHQGCLSSERFLIRVVSDQGVFF